MTSATTNAESIFAYIGCRTTRERKARGDGINVYRIDMRDGAWSHVQLVPDLVNPSFLACHRRLDVLYTIHGDASEISAFRIDRQSGHLTPLNRQSTQGRNPVHLAMDPTCRFMVVPNHLTSTVALLKLAPDTGALGEVCDLVSLSGRIGPHRVEQPFAKPHQAEFSPDGRFVLVPDKGLDCVFGLRIDAEAGRLVPTEQGAMACREASGPRHLAFHPTRPLAYVLGELNSTITACAYDAQTGALCAFQVVPSLDDRFTGDSRAAEIAVSADGRFVYASNRGSDSIGAFAIDAASGRLAPVAFVPSGGRTPRFFALDPSGRHLFAANEESDSIVGFSVDAASGRITPNRSKVSTGSPVCILFRAAG